MRSFSLTQTILLKTSRSSTGSRFVLTFKLHVSSLNGLVDTTIFSSSSPSYASCCSRLYVPEEGSVCSFLSWCLIFSSANNMQRLYWSSPLFSESSPNSSDSPDKLSSSPYPSTCGHSPDSWSSPRCPGSSLNETFFFQNVVHLSTSSEIFSTNVRTTFLLLVVRLSSSRRLQLLPLFSIWWPLACLCHCSGQQFNRLLVSRVVFSSSPISSYFLSRS